MSGLSLDINGETDGISKKILVESIKYGEEYVHKLEILQQSIDAAKLQVIDTSNKAKSEIENAFTKLEEKVILAFRGRKEKLLNEIKVKQDIGLVPLQECENFIEKKVSEATDFNIEAKRILKSGGVTNSDQTISFRESLSLLGSLPAVPDLEIVPDVSFHCPLDTHINDLNKYINNIGKISKMGPVQISQFIMKPGALLVKWEEVDVELQTDDQIFRLQMAHDDIKSKVQLADTNFHDIYTGPELEYLVRNLEPNQNYTFRICSQNNEDEGSSAWSLLKVAKTSLAPFTWDSNSNYLITNDEKIMTKTSNNYSVLYSKGPQLLPQQSVEFTILQCVTGLSEEGLALCTHKLDKLDCMEKGVLFINTAGKIYVDGVLKLTILPEFKKGAKIIFYCEENIKNVLRVHIESQGKAVTYDWKVGSNHALYFAAMFIQNDFKISVA